MGTGALGGASAVGVTAGLAAGAALAALGPTRRLLERVAPDPGRGPSPEAQRRGHYELVLRGSTPGGSTITTVVRGDRDPGYRQHREDAG